MTVLIALEGVLKTEVGDPIPEGIKLFRILAEHHRIVFSSDMDPDKTEHWLRGNLIIGHAGVYDNKTFFEGQDLRLRHLDVARASGKVEMFIDADADYCAVALAMGIPTLLFAVPKFVRTTRTVKPWEDLKNEVNRQREALLDAQLGSRLNRFE